MKQFVLLCVIVCFLFSCYSKKEEETIRVKVHVTYLNYYTVGRLSKNSGILLQIENESNTDIFLPNINNCRTIVVEKKDGSLYKRNDIIVKDPFCKNPFYSINTYSVVDYKIVKYATKDLMTQMSVIKTKYPILYSSHTFFGRVSEFCFLRKNERKELLLPFVDLPDGQYKLYFKKNNAFFSSPGCKDTTSYPPKVAGYTLFDGELMTDTLKFEIGKEYPQENYSDID